VDNGSSTLFWKDWWVGEDRLCVSFRRLFKLAENKLMTIAHMFILGWGKSGEVWKWRRRLFAWEEEML
jgi:hypothetical protein